MEADLLRLNETNLDTLTNNSENLLSRTFLTDSTLPGMPNLKAGNMLPASDQFIHQLAALAQATQVGLTLEGDEGNNTFIGGNSNDLLLGLGGVDRLTGGGGDDLLLGGNDRDLLVGGTGQDGFVYEHSTESLVAKPDRIADFNLADGDKIQLSDLPTNFYYLGNLPGNNLSSVLATVYADKDVTIAGNQALGLNEAVLFSWRGRLYGSVNSDTPAFNSEKDLVFDLTGMRGGLPRKGLGYEEDFFTTQNPSLFEHVSKRWFEQVNESAYPLIGIIDSSFGDFQPDLNYSRLILGSDRIDGDSNPLSSASSSDSPAEHGTRVLGIIGAIRNNNLGINGINDRATIWLGRAIGSGQWANSVIEFVDKAKELNKQNAVLNLSFELTQINPDGTVTTRTQLTAAERAALEYAERNQVIIVAAAGNSAGEMSALAKASQEFDNIITVGAADGYQRANYSNFGESLDILAQGGTSEKPVLSLTANSTDTDGIAETYGTSIAAAKVTGAISHVWGIKPGLNYAQVIDILKRSARDIGNEGRDTETGSGLLYIREAVKLAQNTQPQAYQSSEAQLLASLLKEIPEMFRDEFQSFFNYSEQRSYLDIATWQASNGLTPSENAVGIIDDIGGAIGGVFLDFTKLLNEAKGKVQGWIQSGVNQIKTAKLSDLTSLVKNEVIDGLKKEIETYGAKLITAKDSLGKLFEKIFKPLIDSIHITIDGLAIPSLPTQDSLLAYANNYRDGSLSTIGINRGKVGGWIGEGDALVRNLNPSALFNPGNTLLLDTYRQIARLEQNGLAVPSQIRPEISDLYQSATLDASLLITPVRDELNRLLGQAQGIINDAKLRLQPLKDLATGESTTIFNGVENTINGINNRANAKVTEVTTKIKSKLDTALAEVDKILGSIINLDVTVFEKTYDITDLPSIAGISFPDFFKTGINNAKEQVKSGIKDGYVVDGKQIIPGINDIVDGAKTTFKTFSDLVSNSWKTISTELTNLEKSLNTYVDSAFTQAENALPTLTRFLNPLEDLASLERTLNATLSRFAEEIERELASLESYVFDTFKGKVGGWRDSLENFADNAFEQFKDTTADANKAILEGIENPGAIIDRGIQGAEKILKRLEDIINNPEKYADEVVEAAKKLRDSAKQFGEWLEEKVVDPLVDEAFGLLEGKNSLFLGLDAAKASGLVPSGFVDKVKDNWNDFSTKIHDILSRDEIDKLPNTQKAQVDIVDGLLYVLEGKYRDAWKEGAEDFFKTSVGKIIDAGKQIEKGNWEEALRTFLNEFNIEFPEDQVDRFLKKSEDAIEDVIKDVAVQALAITGISVKTAEAALSELNVDSDGYSNDDQVHGVLNIIGYYNIPYASWIAKAVNLVYHIVEGAKQVEEKQYEESLKQLLTGVLSAVKVQNAADWLDAVFSLKDGIKTKEDRHYIDAVGSVLEAVDVDHGKEWVNGAVDLFNAIKGDEDRYDNAISNIIIAAADIEDPCDQMAIRNGVEAVWKIVDDPKEALILYVKNTAKAELIEQFNLVEKEAGAIVNITADLIKAVNGDDDKYPAIISNLIVAVAGINNSPKLEAWAKELWMRINDPKQGENALKQYLETTAKTQLEADPFKLDKGEAKEFVTIATNLVGAIKGDKNQYPALISNAIIAIANIDSKPEQEKLIDWADKLWDLVNNPKKGVIQYLESEAKKQLQGLGLDEEELKALIEIGKSIISGKFNNVLLQGFNLAGFGKEGMALLKAFEFFKDKDYENAIAKLIEATGAQKVAGIIEIGKALLEVELDPETLLEFDEPKQKVLFKLLTALQTNKPKKEVEQASDAVESD